MSGWSVMAVLRAGEEEAALGRATRLARELGAPLCLIYVGPGDAPAGAWRLADDDLRPLLAFARRRRITHVVW